MSVFITGNFKEHGFLNYLNVVTSSITYNKHGFYSTVFSVNDALSLVKESWDNKTVV